MLHAGLVGGNIKETITNHYITVHNVILGTKQANLGWGWGARKEEFEN